MQKKLTRRGFLAATTNLAWGAAALQAAAAPGRKPAQEKRRKLPVTLRDSILRDVNGDDCWAAVRAVGAEGVEAGIDDKLSTPRLSVHRKQYSLASDSGIARFAADAKAARLRITALAMANRFDERPDFEVEWVKKAAEAARRLGTSTLRIDVVPRKIRGDEFLKFSIGILRRVLAATKTSGVRLAIENHGNTTNRPEFLAKLFAGVKSDRLGLTLDTANFYWFGHRLSSLYDIYERFAPKVFHTHMKSIKYPVASRDSRRPMGWEYAKYNSPLYDGDIDFQRVIRILQKAGYDNDLCIENESLSKFPREKRRVVVAKEVLFLESLR